MTVGASGSTGAVGWDVVRDANRKALFDVLDSMTGSKALIWDSDLVKPFGLIADFRELKIRGVAEMFTLQRGPVPASSVQNVVFICRPKLPLMELVAENLRSQRKDDSRQLHLLFTPRKSVVCESKLNEVDARQKFSTISELPVFFYVWETDLVTMEEPSLLADCVVYDDKSNLHTLAMGLKQVERLYGPIPNVYFKGNLANDVYRFLQKERQNQDDHAPGNSRGKTAQTGSSISSVIILDRLVDPLTPMITQLTYEGLIDEIFGIKCASAKFPKEKFSQEGSDQAAAGGASSSSQDEFRSLSLNSGEELYQDLRDLNFNSVPASLSNFIKTISQEQEERHKATTVHEMKEFVKRLPFLQAAKKSAAVHTTVAELIKDVTRSDGFIETITAEHEILNEVETDKPHSAIEDGMAKGQPWNKILRLMCLQSLAADGLPSKVYDQYRKEFLQSYGYHMLPLLCKLQKAELLRSKPSSSATTVAAAKGAGAASGAARFAFPPIKRTFRLMVDDVDEHNPNDLSYVYSGYAPLTSRLCSYFLKPGWKIIGENLKRLAGATGIEEEAYRQRAAEIASKPTDERKVILVVYIGGVTMAEVSALRFLSKQQDESRFMVLTTSIITGTSLIQSFD